VTAHAESCLSEYHGVPGSSPGPATSKTLQNTENLRGIKLLDKEVLYRVQQVPLAEQYEIDVVWIDADNAFVARTPDLPFAGDMAIPAMRHCPKHRCRYSPS